MAERILVGDQLTPDMISFGSNLIAMLDKQKVAIKGALWLMMPEQKVWRLMIASPEIHTSGPRALYQKILSAMSKLPAETPAISGGDISVIDDKSPPFSLIRLAVSSHPGITGTRLARNAINGQMVEDAYIYRAT